MCTCNAISVEEGAESGMRLILEYKLVAVLSQYIFAAVRVNFDSSAQTVLPYILIGTLAQALPFIFAERLRTI